MPFTGCVGEPRLLLKILQTSKQAYAQEAGTERHTPKDGDLAAVVHEILVQGGRDDSAVC